MGGTLGYWMKAGERHAKEPSNVKIVTVQNGTVGPSYTRASEPYVYIDRV